MKVSEAHGVSVLPPGSTTTKTFIKFSGDSVHGSEHYHDDDGGGVGDYFIQYDDGNDGDDDDDGDIYIMIKCVFVCYGKSSLPTPELSAGGVKLAAR